jgi:hypothetical protein
MAEYSDAEEDETRVMLLAALTRGPLRKPETAKLYETVCISAKDL